MTAHVTQVPVITIDGPSGTGKGTLALHLAQYLQWNYLDSGAIYRAAAWAAYEAEIPIVAGEPLIDFIRDIKIKFQFTDNKCEIYCDDKEITHTIREEWYGELASQLGAIPEARTALLDLQRSFRQPPGLVTDGRDMGTIVFDDADLKLFLTATPEIRAQRRYNQLKEKGKSVSLSDVLADLTVRDQRDASRPTAPSLPSQDAIVIDTSAMTAKDVFQKILSLVNGKFSGKRT